MAIDKLLLKIQSKVTRLITLAWENLDDLKDLYRGEFPAPGVSNLLISAIYA